MHTCPTANTYYHPLEAVSSQLLLVLPFQYRQNELPCSAHQLQRQHSCSSALHTPSSKRVNQSFREAGKQCSSKRWRKNFTITIPKYQHYVIEIWYLTLSVVYREVNGLLTNRKLKAQWPQYLDQ